MSVLCLIKNWIVTHASIGSTHAGIARSVHPIHLAAMYSLVQLAWEHCRLAWTKTAANSHWGWCDIQNCLYCVTAVAHLVHQYPIWLAEAPQALKRRKVFHLLSKMHLMGDAAEGNLWHAKQDLQHWVMSSSVFWGKFSWTRQFNQRPTTRAPGESLISAIGQYVPGIAHNHQT